MVALVEALVEAVVALVAVDRGMLATMIIRGDEYFGGPRMSAVGGDEMKGRSCGGWTSDRVVTVTRE